MKRVFTFLLVLNMSLLIAQQSELKLVSDSLDFDENCCVYSDTDAIKYSYLVTNVGEVALNTPYLYWDGTQYVIYGSMDHQIRVESSLTSGQSPIAYSYLYDEYLGVSMQVVEPETEAPMQYILPGDTAKIIVEDVIMPSVRHGEGSNTIVVWPENNEGVTIPDSITFNILIVASESSSAVSVEDKNPLLSQLNIYPNPTLGILNIDNVNYVQNLKQIVVMDITSKVVKVFNNGFSALNVSDLTGGMYTLNFKLDNGDIYSRPFVVK